MWKEKSGWPRGAVQVSEDIEGPSHCRDREGWGEERPFLLGQRAPGAGV